MPNWTYIDIRRPDGEEILTDEKLEYFEKEFCRKITRLSKEVTEIDFNKFVPQPKLLINRAFNKDTVNAINYYYQNHSLSDKKLEELLNGTEDVMNDPLMDKVLEEYKNAGSPNVNEVIPNWYDWNLKNWGTKWNACYSEIYNKQISFNTAWSMPTEEIMNKLLKVIRDLMIESFPDIPENKRFLSIEIIDESEPYTRYDFTFGDDEVIKKELKKKEKMKIINKGRR